MSAHIVNDETMHQCVMAVQFTAKNWDWPLEQAGLRGATADQIGEALFELNAVAVIARYGDDCGGSDPYRFRFQTAYEQIAGYRALGTLLYQCHEGDVPDSRLYKMLKEYQASIADDIIRNLPQYQKAA